MKVAQIFHLALFLFNEDILWCSKLGKRTVYNSKGVCWNPTGWMTWGANMKSRLWDLLYPMNLWGRLVQYCGSLIRVYDKWIWKPYLEKRLNANLKFGRNKAPQLPSHECVRCGRKIKLALVVCEGADTGSFCCVACVRLSNAAKKRRLNKLPGSRFGEFQ